VKWSYNTTDAKLGPLQWPKLDPAFVACGDSQTQSPIDLFTFRMSSLSTSLLTLQYKASRILLRNTGNNLRIVPDAGSQLYLGDDIFDLVFIQVHTPAEHRIGGETFPLELQLYHKSQETADIAAVSILFQKGVDNTFISQILSSFSRKELMIQQSIDLADLVPKDVSMFKTGTNVGYPYYSYEGSLTNPPCTQHVKWFVWSKPEQASAVQIQALRALVTSDSARPVQDQGKRIVEFKSLF
jgi:carbonic anhydrase